MKSKQLQNAKDRKKDRTRTSRANQLQGVPIKTFKFSHFEKYAAKSRLVAFGAWARWTTASGSTTKVPEVKKFSTSDAACWTLRSMSIVNRGVSGMVSRK